MTEDVTTGESQTPTTPSVENQEQENVNQDVENQGQQSTDIVENYKKAMQKEREKRKKLQEKLDTITIEPQSSQVEEIETVKENGELEQLRANQLIMNKRLDDPTFVDRVDLVKDYMVQNPGVSVDQADDAVLAKFTREAIKTAQPKPQPVLNQITTSAIPEGQSATPVSGLDDVITGKGTTGDKMLDATFQKLANGKPYGTPRVLNAVIRDPRRF